MSNGVAKLLEGSPKAREVDLLADFYSAWQNFHRRCHDLRDVPHEEKKDELQGLSQTIVECSVAIEYYRNRHARKQ